MLWRHLAYCHPLLEKDKDAHPVVVVVDDDSDLECELEAFPTVSNEVSAEAAACVKVLMASSSSSKSCIEKGLVIEAPLTINIPRTKSKHPLENPQVVSSTSGLNISIPVFVPTQLLPAVPCAEGLDNANGCTNINLPPRKKRKPWSAAEDGELFAAVKKYGEGNWTQIVKSDFMVGRTASQMSQRWNTVKKRQNHPVLKTSSQLSEILAARHALNMALDKPRVDIPKPASTLGRTCPRNISVQPLPTAAEPPSSTTLMQNYDSIPTGVKREFPRPQPFPNRPLASGPDAVKAAAVAAGARIATQSAAAEILKQHLKSAIHIKTTRSPPATGAHMGPGYCRAPCSRLSPKTPGCNLSHAHSKVVQLNQSSTGQDLKVSSAVNPFCTANSPKPKPEPEVLPMKEDQVVGNLGPKDEHQDTDPPRMKLEAEGQ